MRALVVATRNRHKVREIASSLAGVAIELAPLPDSAPEVVEDGLTFAANAVKKAEAAVACTGSWALADDSGIEVDALGGAPGVLSARFAGVSGPGADEANNRLLLARLAGIPEERRGARFRAVVALARPGEPTLTFAGVVEGRVTEAAVGSEGFGYDPLFLYAPFGRTFGEVPLARKLEVSHRAQALALLRHALARLFG